MRTRRTFSPAAKARVLQRQHGLCACGCGEPLGTDPSAFEFDHQHALALGGPDTEDNLRAKLKKHHLQKTKDDIGRIAKVKRIQNREGLMRRRLNQTDKALQRMLENRP